MLEVNKLAKGVSSWAQLNSILQKTINNILENEVAEVVKNRLVYYVKDTVYDAGTPEYYVRRNFNNGSLGDRNTMETEWVSLDTIKITPLADYQHESATDYSGNPLAKTIQDGYGTQDKWYNQPRPFVNHARDDIRNSKLHVTEMKKGLTKRGLKVL